LPAPACCDRRYTAVAARRSLAAISGEQPVRAVFLVLTAIILLGGCSDDKPAAASTASDTSAEAILKKNCADAKWKEQNLGLWYSVCRQPLRW
jgi:hypothetical protein